MGLRESIDLRSAHLRMITDLLDRYVHDIEVWAYGSRVEWTSHPASDLDLVVFADESQLGSVTRLREAFENSNLPILVDVHIWDLLPSSFHEQITKNYAVLQHRSTLERDSGSLTDLSLGDFAPFAYGKSLPKSKRKSKGDVPVYGSDGLIGYHDTSLTRGPAVIIGHKGTVGSVHYSAVPCWPIDTTFYIEGMDTDLVRYKYYLLQSLGLDQMNADSAVPGLNRQHAHARRISVHSISAQRTVARVLGSLDDKIELNRRTSQTLEAMAQALFKSWFVDFDPVRAKAEGRPSGLPPDVDTVFPDAFEDSELGKVPEGWSVLPLRRLVDHLRDVEDPQSSPEASFEHYSIPAFDQDQLPRQEFGRDIKSRKFSVPARAVLVSRLNPGIERIWLVATEGDEKAICSTEFLVLRSQAPVHDSYVYCLTRSRPFHDSIKSLVTGTSNSHQRARTDAVLSLNVIYPTALILGEFDRQTRVILDQSLRCRRVSRNIAEQRDALLPRLLSGKLRVDGAKRWVTA